MGSSIDKSRLLPITLVAFTAICANAHAAIMLDKLTACEDIQHLLTSLKGSEQSYFKDCRAAGSSLESALFSRVRNGRAGLCLMKTPPTPILAGFSCIGSQSAPAKMLSCFRPARLADLRAFKNDHDSLHDESGVAYLSKAATCPASNSNTSWMFPTTYPMPLTLISRFEFGFIDSLGSRQPSGDYVFHSFAVTDPALKGIPPAIEVIHFLVDGEIYEPPGQRKVVNSWLLSLDNNDAFDDALNAQFKRITRFRVDSIDFSIRRKLASAGGDKDIVDRLQRALSSMFEDEGFGQFDEDDFKKNSGKTYADVVKEMDAQTPYGARWLIRPGPWLTLFNKERPACASGSQSVMGVYIFSTRPDPDVLTDYGNLRVTVAGIGACARASGAPREFMQGLLEEAKNHIVDSLEQL